MKPLIDPDNLAGAIAYLKLTDPVLNGQPNAVIERKLLDSLEHTFGRMTVEQANALETRDFIVWRGVAAILQRPTANTGPDEYDVGLFVYADASMIPTTTRHRPTTGTVIGLPQSGKSINMLPHNHRPAN